MDKQSIQEILKKMGEDIPKEIPKSSPKEITITIDYEYMAISIKRQLS
ncbi:hypothetical protein [Clostridium sp. Marseille-QA1073]